MQKTRNYALVGLFVAILSCSFLTKKPESLSYKTVAFKGYSFHTVVLRQPDEVQLVHKDSAGKKIKTLENAVLSSGSKPKPVRFATNAGMFHPSHDPVGLYVEQGNTLFPLKTDSGRGNFYLLPNGVLHWDNTAFSISTTEAFSKEKPSPVFATQSGPMLVIDGEVHPAFREGSQNQYIRSGVGILPSGELVFCLSTEPVNFHTFGLLFKNHFHCQDALYLDGSISQMYLQGQSEPTAREFGPMIIAY
jgi:uncharacterized protein YigE (DUF2233 family)